MEDLDWEVKEETLVCLENILQFVLQKYGNTKSLEELAQILKKFGLVNALTICLADYDQRFLHNTYKVLQKLHAYLAQQFHSDDFQHQFGKTCDGYYNIAEGLSKGLEDIHNCADEMAQDMPKHNDENKEMVLSKILEKDNFSPNEQNKESISENGKLHTEKKPSKYEDINSAMKSKFSASMNRERNSNCAANFLQLIRFGINFDIKLKEFDNYCKNRISLESVLDDIISSIGEGNVIEEIDCF